MATEAFIDHNFTHKTLGVVAQANQIVSEYMAQGFRLTLRQLYYQFVARDWIPNSQRSYKRLGSILGNARLAGLVDWRAIEDRTRELSRNSHWTNEKDIIDSVRRSFAIDKWKDQPRRVEVWIEKEALAGVIQPVCRRLDIAFFACRGYPSLSEMYDAGKRFARYNNLGQEVHIIHLGDHDPSGIDMTRDIQDRVTMLAERMVPVDRLALNWDQIDQYQPPPNFAKLSDSRAGDYVAEHGYESWELDALEPRVLANLIETAVIELRDEAIWNESMQTEQEMASNLNTVYNRWGEVVEFIRNGDG